jgi:hypothetical protein
MQGLIREARDLTGIRKDVAAKKDADASPPANAPPDAPIAGGGPSRKRSER